MSILETNTVDGLAITEDEKGVVMLISDHLDWEDEKNHLLVLQEKLNSYILFLESKQYSTVYPDIQPEYSIIEIRFKYDISENADKFINTVNNQLSKVGISINYSIS